MTQDVWRIHDDTMPRSLNSERNKHHMAVHRLVQDEIDRWSWRFKQAGLHRVKLDAIGIEAYPTYSGRRHDAGNCYPTVKAAIDALTTKRGIGTITDDGPDVVRYVTMHAADRQDRVDGMTIVVRREPSVRLDLAAVADALRPLAEGSFDQRTHELSEPQGGMVFVTDTDVARARVALVSLGFAVETA